MGTLTHPLVTLHAAFSHPLLPHQPYNTIHQSNTSQLEPTFQRTAPRLDVSAGVSTSDAHVVMNPLTLTIKRTLGSAHKINDQTKLFLLREDLVRSWQRVHKALESRYSEIASGLLSGMLGTLDSWVDSGREVTTEFTEMEDDVRRVLQGVTDGGVIVEGITVPKAVLKKGDVVVRRPTPIPSWSSAETSTSSETSHMSEKSRRTGKNRYPEINEIQPHRETRSIEYAKHRRESEKFVRDALSRGEPVTLFSTDNPLPPPSHFTGKRDITPNPTDLYSLRQGPGHEPFSQTMVPHTPTSPRKRAALYNSPRWPTGGRPAPGSPDSPTSTGSRTPTARPRGGMEIPVRDGDLTSLYESSLYGPSVYESSAHESGMTHPGLDGRQGVTSVTGNEGGKFSDDEDPAMRIWKGIDEEYSSLQGGGGIMRKRWIRRQGSLRPSKAASMRSPPSSYAD